ncbi:MAG: NFACT RNA binding domain-containing protein [Gammaproteobacteria bacterium]|nr:NFACT RNA binding domain-containing protein [Gammaproteobacteria bacterium]
MQWDSLLVAATARALGRELRAGRTRALHLDRGAGRVALFLRGRTVVFALHPASTGLAVIDETTPPAGAVPLAGIVREVSAPADERAILVEITRLRGRTRRTRLVLELSPGRWNAILTEGPDDRIRSLLRPRRSGERKLLPGAVYELPRPSKRRGATRPMALTSWRELFRDVEPRQRVAALVRNVAYTSRMNARAFLDDGDEDGWKRWRRWRDLKDLDPRLLSSGRGLQPYPYPLPGIEGGARETLLAALTDGSEALARASLVPSEVMSALEKRIGAAEGRLVRLQEQLARLEDPVRMRGIGDLLLARMKLIPRGAARVSLEDFEGGTIRVSLDPTLAPHENAARYYARAARVDRAAATLPGEIEEADARLAAWYALSEEVGEGSMDAGELERRLGLPASGARSRKRAARLPYHRFLSSAGSEIRVGRGAKSNHELTFHHSDPDDIWLHARHASGAHVILRWRGEGSPSPRDLEEAAILAAVHSKGRTSATVPVDWTRRKYVRKPRGAPPGTVTLEREKTVFVSPDAEVAKRLRVDPDRPAA